MSSIYFVLTMHDQKRTAACSQPLPNGLISSHSAILRGHDSFQTGCSLR